MTKTVMVEGFLVIHSGRDIRTSYILSKWMDIRNASIPPNYEYIRNADMNEIYEIALSPRKAKSKRGVDKL